MQQIHAACFASASYLDALVGRLLDTLDSLGLAAGTRIPYTSDHGFSRGEHYLLGLFHLVEDPLESRNPASEQPQLLARQRLRHWLDPDAVDARAKADQRSLIRRHGGKQAVLQRFGGFSCSPPPGLSWREMNP